MATPPAQSLEKALHLLRIAVADEGNSALSDLAATAGLPASTAHRFALSLQRAGFLLRDPGGRYWPGPILLGMQDRISHGQVLARICRPILRRLADASRQTAHLGILQDDMVTYLVKECAAQQPIFTREGMQLEAYCSAIGRVLLAFLPAAARDAYMTGGAFVALTARTLTAPHALRAELDRVSRAGFAVEQAEVSDEICCIAAPVRSPDGVVRAAISVACPTAIFGPAYRKATVKLLLAAAQEIGARAYVGKPKKGLLF